MARSQLTWHELRLVLLQLKDAPVEEASVTMTQTIPAAGLLLIWGPE